MPNGADWVTALTPIARDILRKLTSGQRITAQEQQFALMFSLVDSSTIVQRELVALRQDFNRLCSAVERLTSDVSEVARDTAYLKGRLE
jgi:hypothetical protein